LHYVLVSSGVVPDDRYLASMTYRFWDSDDIVIQIEKGPLEKWSAIRKWSKSVMTKLRKAERPFEVGDPDDDSE
jgi:hypothetical protein